MKALSKLFTISAVLSISSVELCAQVNVQNQGILTVKSNTDVLYINGSFTNTAAASLVNNGGLYINRDLTNNQASMSAGTGTLFLNGTSLQTVSGTETFKTYNLVTMNSAGMLLNNNLSVLNSHTFLSGIITTSATPNYLIYESGSFYANDADSRHVNGWVKKFGATNFIFPVGNGAIERPIALGNLTLSSEFNAKYSKPAPNYMSVQYPLVMMDTAEYWSVNKISGGTAQVIMNWDNSKVGFPNFIMSDIRGAYYNGSMWTDAGGSASGSTSGTGTLTTIARATFGNFAFGSMATLLNVRLVDIKARQSGTVNVVEWKASEDKDVDHYAIERSDAGSAFKIVGTVASRVSSGVQSYSFTDGRQFAGTIGYRIRAVNKNGQPTLSKVALLSASNELNSGITIINPAHAEIKLAVEPGANGMYNFSLVSPTGTVIAAEKLSLDASKQTTVSLPQQMIPGVYFIRLVNDRVSESRKVFLR